MENEIRRVHEVPPASSAITAKSRPGMHPDSAQFCIMSSDPRVHKPRLPKAYTDQQLTFLKRYRPPYRDIEIWALVGPDFSFLVHYSNLPEFERRSQGSIRGDAKKFALERATEFIARFGLPEEFHGVEESESRFREVRV